MYECVAVKCCVMCKLIVNRSIHDCNNILDEILGVYYTERYLSVRKLNNDYIFVEELARVRTT